LKRITSEQLKPITAALFLGAAVLLTATGVRADGQTASQSSTQGTKSADDDAALMEFLGGIGSEDDAWIDYLARTDPTKVASQPKQARSDGAKPSDPPRASADSSNGSEK
jgi:hypothetical protein